MMLLRGRQLSNFPAQLNQLVASLEELRLLHTGTSSSLEGQNSVVQGREFSLKTSMR